MRSIALISSALLIFALGCGTPGAPQPPSLRLPEPVNDLSATRKGDRVVLTWTPPTRTTDKQTVTKQGFTHVCRSLRYPLNECGSPAASLGPDDGTVLRGDPPRKLFEDKLSPELQRDHPTEFVTYAVEVMNARGRSAGASNQLRIPLAPSLAPPTKVDSRLSPDGVVLSWQTTSSTPASDLHYAYRVSRRLRGAKEEVQIALVPLNGSTLEFLDRSFEWEQAYEYYVTGITEVRHNNALVAEVDGDDSPIVSVVAQDTFPPAQPGGVQAVFSGPGQKAFIDLTWAPNLEADLAGYNVYRWIPGAQPEKISPQPVKAPSFRDEHVEPASEYFYAVTAVDLRGNESERSAEASERTAQ